MYINLKFLHMTDFFLHGHRPCVRDKYQVWPHIHTEHTALMQIKVCEHYKHIVWCTLQRVSNKFIRNMWMRIKWGTNLNYFNSALMHWTLQIQTHRVYLAKSVKPIVAIELLRPEWRICSTWESESTWECTQRAWCKLYILYNVYYTTIQLYNYTYYTM